MNAWADTACEIAGYFVDKPKIFVLETVRPLAGAWR